MSESVLSWPRGTFIGGLSDPSTTQFRKRRAVFDLVNQLHSHGLQGEMDIPQIAVVGSQSVGKSSLIESIAGITLPRAQGTCTRCPIECRLSTTKTPWSCEVYLRLVGHSDEIPFGGPLTDRSEVEERIRRAQLAILNPSRRAEDFLGTLGSTSTSKEVDNLMFVDLPGVIASVRYGGAETDIEEVENLVLDVINKPSCLILLVVSAETDPENQGGQRLARRADPLENRTILVTTKPDRIPRGEELRWLRYLSENGGFCVKQRDQRQLSSATRWVDAREEEEKFFANTWPWHAQAQAVESKFGTPNLTRALGAKLYYLICERLPGLVQEVEQRIRFIKDDIKALPTKVTGDPVARVWNLVDAFKKDVEQLVKGRPDAGKDGLIQTFRQLKGEFREAIKVQAPDFRPYNRSLPSRRGFVSPRSPGVSGYAVGRTSVVSMHTEDFLERDVDEISATPVVYLNEVLDFAQSAITRELPHNHPYAVIEHYVALFTKRWPVPAQKLFDRLESGFQKDLKRLVTEHFAAYAPGNLDSAVMSTVLDHLTHCGTAARDRVEQCIALEREEPMTLNEDILAEYKSKYRAEYIKARHTGSTSTPSLQTFLSSTFDSDTMRQVLESLQQMGFGHVTKDDLLRSLPVDKSDDGIKFMSEVRAYYEVAYRRYIDNIPMIIDYELLKGFSRTLGSALFTGLGLREDICATCADFLKEDPQIVRSRERLQQDLLRFNVALASLQKISKTGSMPGQSPDEVLAIHHVEEAGYLAEDGTSNVGYTNNYTEGLPQPLSFPSLPTSPALRPFTPIREHHSSAEYSSPIRRHSLSMSDGPVAGSSTTPNKHPFDWGISAPPVPAEEGEEVVVPPMQVKRKKGKKKVSRDGPGPSTAQEEQ